MNRDDLRELAHIRLEDARVLLENKRYEGAYYLCGYVVECGLKACIAKRTKQYDFPDKNLVGKVFTHNLERLVELAGLKPDLDQEIKKDRIFKFNWLVVKDWSEEIRYQKHGEKKANGLYSAITDERGGVLQWIKKYW